MEELSDNELMGLVKNDDRLAFEELVKRHRGAAERFARGIINDPQAAEEIVQDCFVKLWLYREKYRTDLMFKTYFYTLIKHAAIDEMRKRRIFTGLQDDQNEEIDENSPETIFVEKEIIGSINEKIKVFREKNGDCLYLFAVCGMRAKDIAKKLGMSEVNVRVKIYRDRIKLRKLLEKEGLL